MDLICFTGHFLSDDHPDQYSSGCELFLDMWQTTGTLDPGLFWEMALVYSHYSFCGTGTFFSFLFHNNILDQKTGNVQDKAMTKNYFQNNIY